MSKCLLCVRVRLRVCVRLRVYAAANPLGGSAVRITEDDKRIYGEGSEICATSGTNTHQRNKARTRAVLSSTTQVGTVATRAPQASRSDGPLPRPPVEHTDLSVQFRWTSALIPTCWCVGCRLRRAAVRRVPALQQIG